MTVADQQQPRREEVVVDGVPAACWVHGSDDAAHRVVALHGLRGTHHGLALVAVHLPDVRLLVPDLPGFGESPPLTEGAHDVDGYARWAGRFVDAACPGAVVLGHSFGSIVAAALAASTPDPAALPGLVLLNPIASPALDGTRRVATAVTTGYHRFAAALPERAGTALLRSRVATRIASATMVTTHDPALRRWIHAEHDRHFNDFADRRVLLECYGAAVAHDVTEHAAAVRAPTLLVAGALDEVAPLPAQRRLVEMFDDASLVVLPGTGHLAHYEAPAAIAVAVAAFLDRLDA